MKQKKSILLSILLAIAIIAGQSEITCMAKPKVIPVIILNHSSKTLAIDDEFWLVALSSTGKMPTFRSSDSSVASVNTYGVVTAKKAGKATITAKIKHAEASCKVTVAKPTITISRKSATMENGSTLKLSSKISTGHDITWKSESSSVASVDEDGIVTAKKIGTAIIRASADGVSAKCKVTVKKPSLKLNQSSIALYRTQHFKLNVRCSSNVEPTFKSNKSSVATVDETGLITAVKHGSATITVKVDGVTKTCTVTVNPPTITLDPDRIQLKVGEQFLLKAAVSTPVTPVWSTSNENRLSVDQNGLVTAREAGKAYVYVKEDGAKASCLVEITE